MQPVADDVVQEHLRTIGDEDGGDDDHHLFHDLRVGTCDGGNVRPGLALAVALDAAGVVRDLADAVRMRLHGVADHGPRRANRRRVFYTTTRDQMCMSLSLMTPDLDSGEVGATFLRGLDVAPSQPSPPQPSPLPPPPPPSAALAASH